MSLINTNHGQWCAARTKAGDAVLARVYERSLNDFSVGGRGGQWTARPFGLGGSFSV
jgi:hypothetical protein